MSLEITTSLYWRHGRLVLPFNKSSCNASCERKHIVNLSHERQQTTGCRQEYNEDGIPRLRLVPNYGSNYILVTRAA